MHQAVIIDGVRTPFMHSHKSFVNFSSFDLGRLAIQGLMSKTGMDSSLIEHLIMGTVIHDPKTPNIARECALGADISSSTPCHTVSLACISSNLAATQLADMITLKRLDVGIFSGVDTCSDPPIRLSENLRKSLVKLSKLKSPKDYIKSFNVLKGLSLSDMSLDVPKVAEFSNGKTMGQGAEALAMQAGISRSDSDAFAARSHHLAVKATKEGIIAKNIISVYPQNMGAIDKDDGPREDTTLEKLSKLRPAFDSQFGVCTAGNSSFLTDGASAVLMMSMEKSHQLGVKPLAIIKDYVYGAGDPLEEMLSGPALTIPRLLERNSLSIKDIDVWEIHEAFACQVLANLVFLNSPSFAKKRLGVDKEIGEIPMEKINIWGGSLSLGHPFGATGGRLLYTAAKRLVFENARFAIVSGCAAGGHGSAILLENPQ